MTNKIEHELSELEIKVLKLVKQTMRRKYIISELALTYRWAQRIFKKLKELGYTRIQGFWWSWCTCKFNESKNHCDCDGSPEVWRHTVVSEKWNEFLLNIK